MPELITFRGRPVKRRYKTHGGLRLVLYHPHRGFRGNRLIVTEDEWDLYGRVQFYPKDQMPDVRALAAQV